MIKKLCCWEKRLNQRQIVIKILNKSEKKQKKTEADKTKISYRVSVANLNSVLMWLSILVG